MRNGGLAALVVFLIASVAYAEDQDKLAAEKDKYAYDFAKCAAVYDQISGQYDAIIQHPNEHLEAKMSKQKAAEQAKRNHELSFISLSASAKFSNNQSAMDRMRGFGDKYVARMDNDHNMSVLDPEIAPCNNLLSKYIK